MASPAPALLQLRDQVYAKWPGRSRASDGIMGDRGHRLRPSDHNQGNALDLTDDIAHGFSAPLFAESLRHQMSHSSAGRVSYLISDERIASPKTGWRWVPYRGKNPHKTHVHISIRADKRTDTRPWNLS